MLPNKFSLKIICFWVSAKFVTRPLTLMTSSDLHWLSRFMVDDHILYLGLIWVCIPKLSFMGAVVNILYENKWFLPFFSEKMDRKRDRGTPENGDMQVFSIRILFSTLIDTTMQLRIYLNFSNRKYINWHTYGLLLI